MQTFSYLLLAVPQVQPQPTPRDDPYRTEPGWCGYLLTPLHRKWKKKTTEHSDVIYTFQLPDTVMIITYLTHQINSVSALIKHVPV